MHGLCFPRFQHLLRGQANVNSRNTMFDPHNIDYTFVLAESKMDRKDKLFVINEVRIKLLTVS